MTRFIMSASLFYSYNSIYIYLMILFKAFYYTSVFVISTNIYIYNVGILTKVGSQITAAQNLTTKLNSAYGHSILHVG